MKVALTSIASAIIICFFASATTAATHKEQKLTTKISATQTATWRCQDQVAAKEGKKVRSTRTGRQWSPWALPKSQKYRQATLKRWQTHRDACFERLRLLRSFDAVVRRLDRGLAGTPMAGLGAILERVGRQYHISPFFMAAAAYTESSAGAAACSNNHMNVWGLSSCGAGWYVPTWSSWEDAITFYAKFLNSHWPNATTTYSYSGYAACSSCWGAKTAEHMRLHFGVGNSVRYP